MNKIKKIIFSIVVMLGFVFIIDSQQVQAESDLEIEVKESMSIKFTDYKTVKVKVYYDGEDVTEYSKLSFKSSDKSVAKVDEAEDINSNYDGTYVSGFNINSEGVGKSTITITATYRTSNRPFYWDGEKYWDDEDYWDDEELEEVYDEETITATAKCVVKSKYFSSIRADADLIDYNTRDNTFTIEVYNLSNKSITIMSSGAEAFEDDYVAFDRNLRLTGNKSSVTIKPGQRKKVKFKVIGDLTWYNHEDFQICSYWKWGNKKYWVSVMPEETWVKLGKKWKWIGFPK